LGSYLGIGSCISEARVGRDGLVFDSIGTPRKGGNAMPLCKHLRLEMGRLGGPNSLPAYGRRYAIRSLA